MKRNMELSGFIASLDLDESKYKLMSCCVEILEGLKQHDLKQMAHSKQTTSEWHSFRKLRITGAVKDHSSLVDSCDFIVTRNEKVGLKKKHAFYGQVQLGMALLNLKSCDFIVYSSFSNSHLIMDEPFDEEFVASLLTIVSLNYFSHMLHVHCENS